ncbi:MAG: hypothetical protein ABSF98_10330 [Bryobacteraceae bacterium]
MYLIADEQFNDVVLQENNRKVDGTRLVPPLEQLAGETELELPGVKTYGCLLIAGNEAGHPVLTFTATRGDTPPIGPPSEPYLKTIAAGLKETYPSMEDGQIAEYLLRADGVSGRIPPDRLAKWVAGSYGYAAGAPLQTAINR